MPRLQNSVPLGVLRPHQSEEEALVDRIRMVLQTRPGQIPWRPEFGCNLEGMLGAQASKASVVQARYEVQRALSRFLPDVEVAGVRVNAVPQSGSRDRFHLPEIPVAERALVGTGAAAVLQVDVDIQTDAGILTIQALVDN
ncbi:MAG: GPW/gp25 family protein [Myxococcota bacterium]|nr:GPW/gp25 family protein [Myxococcota bacterium]